MALLFAIQALTGTPDVRLDLRLWAVISSAQVHTEPSFPVLFLFSSDYGFFPRWDH
jgi:hypothetical protein